MAAKRNKAKSAPGKTKTKAKGKGKGPPTKAKDGKRAVAAKKSAKPSPGVNKAAKPVKAVKAAKRASSDGGETSASPPGLGVGDPVPEFALPDQRGEMVSSKSLVGKPFVLYFYPKDDTPGCTREACGFRDDQGKFDGTGLTVVGVSPDDTKSHARFATKYGLGFTLLSDTEKSLARAFGVWVKKQNYGREYMGIQRSTFLVDASGKVQRVWRSVKVDGHVAAVLAAASGS